MLTTNCIFSVNLKRIDKMLRFIIVISALVLIDCLILGVNPENTAPLEQYCNPNTTQHENRSSVLGWSEPQPRNSCLSACWLYNFALMDIRTFKSCVCKQVCNLGHIYTTIYQMHALSWYKVSENGLICNYEDYFRVAKDFSMTPKDCLDWCERQKDTKYCMTVGEEMKDVCMYSSVCSDDNRIMRGSGYII